MRVICLCSGEILLCSLVFLTACSSFVFVVTVTTNVEIFLWCFLFCPFYQCEFQLFYLGVLVKNLIHLLGCVHLRKGTESLYLMSHLWHYFPFQYLCLASLSFSLCLARCTFLFCMVYLSLLYQGCYDVC